MVRRLKHEKVAVASKRGMVIKQYLQGFKKPKGKRDERFAVKVTTLKEAKEFSKPGMKVACAIPYDASKSWKENLAYVRRLNAYGIIRQCSLIDAAPWTARPAGRQRSVRELLMRRAVNAHKAFMTKLLKARYAMATMECNAIPDFDVEQTTDPDGIPVIIIITEDGRLPRYIIESLSRKDWEKRKKGKGRHGQCDDGGDGDDNQLLRKPLKDQMLIDGMRDVDKKLTAGQHMELLTWNVMQGSRTKGYNNCHLLTCLFFYVWLNKLYRNPGFYNQRKAFFNYCENHLGKDFELKSYRAFYENINKLQSEKPRFDECIKGTVEPSREKQVGKVELYFWLLLYRKAMPYFKHALTPDDKT